MRIVAIIFAGIVLFATGAVAGRIGAPTWAPWEIHPEFQDEYNELASLWKSHKIEGVVSATILGRPVSVEVVATKRDAWYGFVDDNLVNGKTRLFYHDHNLTARATTVRGKTVVFVIGEGIPEFIR